MIVLTFWATLYMDVLINRLRRSGLGCCMANNYCGCLVYADDIILLPRSVNTMRSMFAICEQFAFDFDMTQKSVVMRVGERYDVMCAPLMLDEKEILFVHSLKYLGVHLVVGKCFSCCFKSVRMQFYRTLMLYITGLKV